MRDGDGEGKGDRLKRLPFCTAFLHTQTSLLPMRTVDSEYPFPSCQSVCVCVYVRALGVQCK